MKRTHNYPTYKERLKIIGVMGSGSDPHPDLSKEVGRIIADLGCHLLTGGGKGVMAEVSQAFAEVKNRAGLVIGVIKAKKPMDKNISPGDKRVYATKTPNKWIDIPIFTHLHDSGKKGRAKTSRNHINVLTSDVVVGLPGGTGTLSEVHLAIEYERPLVMFVGSEKIGENLPHELASNSSEFVDIAGNPNELKEYLIKYLGR